MSLIAEYPAKVKTAVVILNWNTEDFLRKFLPCLIDSTKKVEGAEVIVADNASKDGSMAVMKELFPDVKTIEFERNLGFTGGYNAAFKHLDSMPDAPEYLVLINSDIEVTENWLQPLVDWMDTHPECGACAPKLHSWQEKHLFEYAGAAGGFIDRYGYPFCRGRVMKRLEQDNGQYDLPADVFWATGACLVIRSSVYRQLNGLDERFFAHMEEIDLCWRMQLRGHKVTVVPQSLVYHVGGGTLPASSPFKLFLNFRNNLLMLSNNLAMTYALGYRKEGMKIESAARRGKRTAAFTIFCRMVLDSLSALVYALTLNTAALKSVIKAHKEYKKLKTDVSVKKITEYLADRSSDAEVVGIYRKWIVLLSMVKGDGIFGFINEKDFFKF